jgi:hypothetical protein
MPILSCYKFLDCFYIFFICYSILFFLTFYFTFFSLILYVSIFLVIYLDFVDFGHRRVSDSFPRISVWKGNMIQSYSDLDIKSNGCYGFRPILNFSDTCYFKVSLFLLYFHTIFILHSL